jgi:hypothetical protein
VVTLMAVGVLLRLGGITRFPFEQDELYTVAESTRLFQTTLQPGIDARPLYYLVQHALLPVLPATEAGMRALPLLFGVLGLWATWVAGSRLLGRTAGIVALALAVVSPWHLYASGMARYWSLVYLLAVLALYFVARGLQDDRPRDLAAAACFLALGTATHPTFVFPLCGAALGAWLVRPGGRPGWSWPTRRAWTWLWGPYALFLAAAFAALQLAGRESAVQNWNGRGWAATLRLLPAVVDWATPTLVAAAGLGAVALAWAGGSEARRRWGAMALGGWASGVALLWAASLRTDVYADYAMALLPILLLSAGGLVQLGVERLSRGAGAATAAAVLVMWAGMASATASHLASGTRFDYRPAFRHAAAAAPQLPVYAWPLVVLRHYTPDARAHELHLDRPRLDAALRRHGELWLVASIRRHGLVGDDAGAGAAWIREHCTLARAHDAPRWDYRVYRVELHRCGGARVGAPQQVARPDHTPPGAPRAAGDGGAGTYGHAGRGPAVAPGSGHEQPT